MIIFDSSFLVVLLYPTPPPCKDRADKPVTQFKERVAHLVATMDVKNEVIGVPAPAMAEVLVRAGKGRAQYVSLLSQSWRFQILPFDSRAAIEAAELIEKIKSNSQPWAQWAKVKFDIQIVSIAKAESATVIYSDDRDVENYAQRLRIPVIRVCDLPLPPPQTETPVDAGPVGAQRTLPLAAPEVASASAPTPQIQTTTPASTEEAPATIEKSTPSATPEKPEEDKPLKATIAGEKESKEEPKPCECGCGEYPKDPKSRFLPGHDLRKVYKDSQSLEKSKGEGKS